MRMTTREREKKNIRKFREQERSVKNTWITLIEYMSYSWFDSIDLFLVVIGKEKKNKGKATYTITSLKNAAVSKRVWELIGV